MAEQAPFYVFTAFVFAYGTGVLHLKRDFLLMAVLAAAMLSFVSIPFFGHLSDRLGRKRVYMLGAAATGVFGFVYFALLDTRVPALVVLAIVLSLIPHDMMYGPQAALIAESFPGRLRYSGASLGYQLSSVIAGGPAPLIASSLVSRDHSAWGVAMFIFGCAIVSLIATAMLKDRTNQEIPDD
jgi:MFS family permease